MITTLLGSCVSVCFYDPVNRIVGMNHYLTVSDYQIQNSQFALTTGRVAEQAMSQVISKMLTKGAQYHLIKAKAFGGASVLKLSAEATITVGPGLQKIGKQNTAFVKAYLIQAKIPLVAHDLEGTTGRVICFNTTDFSVMVKKIKPPSQFNGLLNKTPVDISKNLDWQKSNYTGAEAIIN